MAGSSQVRALLALLSHIDPGPCRMTGSVGLEYYSSFSPSGAIQLSLIDFSQLVEHLTVECCSNQMVPGFRMAGLMFECGHRASAMIWDRAKVQGFAPLAGVSWRR